MAKPCARIAQTLTEMMRTAGCDVEQVGHFFEFVFPDQTPERFLLRATFDD